MWRGSILLAVSLAWGLGWAAEVAADSAAAKALERRWAEIEKPQPNLGVRDLFGFALEAAAIGWRPERVAKGERLACEGADPGSEKHILAINGRDFGREALSPLVPEAAARERGKGQDRR